MPLSLADVLAAQSGAPGPTYEGGPDANVTLGGVLSALGSTWPARMGQDIVQGAMAPGNAYRSTPENPVTTEQMVGPAANLAMLMVGAPGGSGGVGSGARSFSERMAEAQDIAFQRAQRGQATGDYGLGTAKRTAPEAAVGTPEYSSDRLMSSLRDTQRQLAEYKNPQKPLLAPGESPEDFSLFSGGNKKAGAALAGIRAYHGSPYDFEKFDISKIGQGEGAQTYGHGLYFAENPEVAQSYKDQLGGFRFPSLTKEENYATGLIHPALKSAAEKGGPQAAADLLDKYIVNSRRLVEGAAGSGEAETLAALEKLRANKDYFPQYTGKMYEVNINAEPQQFLQWNKPLADQPEQVRKFFESYKGAGPVYPDIPGQNLPGFLTKQLSSGNSYLPSGAERSQIMSEAGIPGIRYLDQGSLGMLKFGPDASGNWDFAHTAPSQQTHNYVVFNPEIVDILKKYGLAGLTMGGVLTAAGQQPAPAQ